jgi:NhaP-type Na+/H+ or K+/H+ antiporter
MEAAAWALIVGALMILMALTSSALKHLPLSTAMLYLLVGLAIGPGAIGLLDLDPVRDAKLLEHLSEVVVLVSLFTVGLKLALPLSDPRWRLPLRLALGSMVITVALIALLGWLIGLPLGAAVLLGAVLAPTDPVLASDVQVSDPEDRDRLRVSLTGEGGLNDGTAFPFVMLGLGLLGLHELGEFGWRWIAVDVLWATASGLAVGAALGTLVGRLVLHLRRRHSQAVGHDDFLALGLIALSYGVAVTISGYGFLAVFAAGVALRRVERKETEASRHEASEPVPDAAEMVEQALTNPEPPVPPDHIATHPAHAPAFMASAMLGSNEQLDRIGELAAVVVIGAMLWTIDLSVVPWWFVPVLFLVVRPVSVVAGLAGTTVPGVQRRLIAWFGIRGIGSIYYLHYAIAHGLDEEVARTLTSITLVTIVCSVIAHGVSVTPAMSWYERWRERRRPNRDARPAGDAPRASDDPARADG